MYRDDSRTRASGGSTIVLNALTFNGHPFTISMPSLHAVGCGATAKIFLGQVTTRDGPLVVAVKVFANTLEDHHEELLIRELQAARQVFLAGHPSILPFIGSASVGLQTAIVSLYMRNGNLLDFFKAHEGSGSIDKKKLIVQVSEAVAHLHAVERLVHGDLKCANVLVSDSGDALLADFGLSTFVEKARTSATTAMNVRQMYTVRFAAPEILRDIAGHPDRVRSKTRETDVYAFGMLVLEAITERPPWAGCEDFAVMLWVCSGLQPSRPATGFSQAWWNVCRSCWALEPEKRPSIQSVRNVLTAHPHQHDPPTPKTPLNAPAWMTWASRSPPQPVSMAAQTPSREESPMPRRADTSSPPTVLLRSLRTRPESSKVTSG